MLLYVWAGKRAKWPGEPHKHVSPQRLHTGKSLAKTPAALSRGPGNVKRHIIRPSHLSGVTVCPELCRHLRSLHCDPGGWACSPF